MAAPALAQKSTYNVICRPRRSLDLEIPTAPARRSSRSTSATIELCWDIKVQNIGDPTAGPAHVGGPGRSGSVMVDLNLPANGLKSDR
jgi:hypothetical protein